jgi:hypothetical protein
MYDDENESAPPLWVRLVRMTICMTIAAGIAWRGMNWDDTKGSVAIPFIMCQATACVMAFLGLFALDSSRDEGPA